MALIKCNNCGGMVSDKANACPHCGTPVKLVNSEPVQKDTLQSQEPIHQVQPETESQLQPVSLPEPQVESTYDWHNEPKKGNGGLVATIIIGVLALLAGAGWLWYDNSQNQAELERQLAIQLEQAQQDSIAAAELREQARQDSIAEIQRQLELKRQAYLHVLSQYQGGQYFLYDITGNGVDELWLNVFEDDYLESWQIYQLVDNQLIRIHRSFHVGLCYKGNNSILIDDFSAIDEAFSTIKLTYRDGKIHEELINYSEYNNHKIPSEPKVKTFEVTNTKPIIETIK